jgi:hypothetical protein
LKLLHASKPQQQATAKTAKVFQMGELLLNTFVYFHTATGVFVFCYLSPHLLSFINVLNTFGIS